MKKIRYQYLKKCKLPPFKRELRQNIIDKRPSQDGNKRYRKGNKQMSIKINENGESRV